jgi:hypothetical protein
MFFGPFDDIHEPDAYLPLIRKSEFCAPCHTGKFWGIPAYNCFPEWQASPYPAMGIECQTCHMFPDSITTHFAHPEKGGLERDPLTIPSHLQPGSRDPKILSNSVTMSLSAEQHQDTIIVMVTIYNDKTGHHVPTGRPSRNMILLVHAEDYVTADLEFLGGETVPPWGGNGDPNDGNYAGLPGKGYAKVLEDFEEHSPSPSWRPTRILSDNRVAAFATDTSYYYFKMPQGGDQISVSAKLLYRRFFKSWMDEKKFDIPDIEMEHDSIVITTTSNVEQRTQNTIPIGYWLGQNYPNPFNKSTVIGFTIKKPGQVTLEIYDTLGRHVKTLINAYYVAGQHWIDFDASDLQSGIFLYEICTGKFRQIRKALYLR